MLTQYIIYGTLLLGQLCKDVERVILVLRQLGNFSVIALREQVYFNEMMRRPALY